jgi:hypothetical protein
MNAATVQLTVGCFVQCVRRKDACLELLARHVKRSTTTVDQLLSWHTFQVLFDTQIPSGKACSFATAGLWLLNNGVHVQRTTFLKSDFASIEISGTHFKASICNAAYPGLTATFLCKC